MWCKPCKWSEKAFKRIWEAHETLQQLNFPEVPVSSNIELDKQVNVWISEMTAFMDDDFSTPKVIANLFELAPIINSLKDGLIPNDSISTQTLLALKQAFTMYLENIFGLQSMNDSNNSLLEPVMQLLLELRNEAKAKKDFATSDKIRKQLTDMGIAIKDEKDGKSSWSIR